MTIGSLFIALGFKVTGKNDFVDAERSLNRMAGIGTKLTIAVNAINWAMLAMVETAMKSAQALRIFEQTTGKSADDLQRWGQAAKVAGLGADALKQAVGKLNDARAAFMLGRPENVGAWSILGANPTEDPFVVLERLRSKMAAVKDPNIMRALLGEVGMEGVMPLLQMTNAEFAEFKKNLTVNSADIDKLVRLNKEWQRFLNALDVAKTKLAAVITPALTRLAKLFTFIAKELGNFTVWLNSGTTAANITKVIINLLVVGLLALGAAIAAITIAVSALSIAMGMLTTVSLPWLLMIGAIAAGLAFLLLMVLDFKDALAGKESLFDWSNSLEMLDKIAARVAEITALWDKFTGGIKAANQIMNGDFNGMKFFQTSAAQDRVAQSQQNAITINLEGDHWTETTMKAVGKVVVQSLDAWWNSPADDQ